MNTINNILFNLYELGYIQTKEKDMANIFSLYNEYKILLSRKSLRFIDYENTSLPKYMCKFQFFNQLNILVLEINTSELDIYKLLDNMSILDIYKLLDNTSQLNQICIPIETIDNQLQKFQFQFTRINENKIQFSIIENNSICRLTTFFDNNIYNDFMDIMYFIFLIDIDNENYDIIQNY